MSWALYAFGAAVFWSLNIVMDKYVVDHEVDDFIVTTIFCSFSAFIVIGAFSILKGASFSSISVPHLSLGFIYALALMAYYSGIGREEISRFAPTLAVDTVFILVLSFLFLGESFSVLVYTGVISVVAGAFLISLDDPLHSLKEFESKKGLYLAIVAAFIFGSRDVLSKFFLINSSYWTVLLGMSVGGLFSLVFLGFYRRKEIIASSDKGLEHLLFLGTLMAGGYICFISAINTGPVSLSSAIVKSQNLLIFGIAVFLQKFHPGVVEEELDRSVLVQKLVAIMLIVLGLLLIQFY